MTRLSGPRIPPARGEATELVVLLHGYGADGQDLIGLASHWRKLLPGAAFVAPDGPQRAPGSPGFQWFPIVRLDPHELTAGVHMAAPALAAFIDGELAQLGLAMPRLALAGFSQGAMLALQLGLRPSARPAAVIGFSGVLTDAPPTESSKPPIFLAHGALDTLIPPEAMFAAAASLGQAGAAVQWHLSANTAHGIGQRSLALAGEFLARAFAAEPRCDDPPSCPL